ncbi:uncharacterized protein TNCV_4569571 [Trichonephila clavipes]|nr:uncharacterized protein TNCV_4569571 [Trichonephila clavipes]
MTIPIRLLRLSSRVRILPSTMVPCLGLVSPSSLYLMDSNLHQDLLKIWTQRSKNATLVEQHCVESILCRDNMRSSDLIKLISILHKISDPKTVYELFAMGGYQGDDPKKYVELYRYDAEDARGKHVQAVRLLYHHEVVNTPQECRSFWKVFSMARAPTPSIKTCTLNMYEDRRPTWQNGVEKRWIK